VEVQPVILDVRTPEEYAEGHVAGSVNVSSGRPPLSAPAYRDLRQRLGALSLPAGSPVLVYCARGIRASAAAQVLRDMGYDARNIGGVHTEPLPSQIRLGRLRWLDAGSP